LAVLGVHGGHGVADALVSGYTTALWASAAVAVLSALLTRFLSLGLPAQPNPAA
jgi:hypothetical protein